MNVLPETLIAIEQFVDTSGGVTTVFPAKISSKVYPAIQSMHN